MTYLRTCSTELCSPLRNVTFSWVTLYPYRVSYIHILYPMSSRVLHSYVRTEPGLQPSMVYKSVTLTVTCPDAIRTHLCSQFPFLIFHTHALSIICHFRNWDMKLAGVIRIYPPCVGPLGSEKQKMATLGSYSPTWGETSAQQIWEMVKLWLRKAWAWPGRPVGT